MRLGIHHVRGSKWVFYSLAKFCSTPDIVRSLSVSIVTGRIQAPIVACTLLVLRIKFSRGSIENISSISSKRVWKNQVNLHKFKMAALSTKILNNSKFVALVMQP